MKRLITLLILSLTLLSQAYGEDNSGILVEANIGITRSTHEYPDWLGVSEKKHYTNALLDVRLGYRFNSRWAVGAMFKRDKYELIGNFPCWGGFVEYTAFNIKQLPLYLFIDLHAYHGKDTTGYIGGWYVDEDGNMHTDGHRPTEFTEVGFTPGIGFHIPHTPIDVKLRYLFVGFNNINDRDYKEVGGCLGRGNWILDAGVRRLEIGISATLNFWKK